MFLALVLRWLTWTTEEGFIFNTGPSSKINILKIVFLHARENQKDQALSCWAKSQNNLKFGLLVAKKSVCKYSAEYTPVAKDKGLVVSFHKTPPKWFLVISIILFGSKHTKMMPHAMVTAMITSSRDWVFKWNLFPLFYFGKNTKMIGHTPWLVMPIITRRCIAAVYLPNAIRKSIWPVKDV